MQPHDERQLSQSSHDHGYCLRCIPEPPSKPGSDWTLQGVSDALLDATISALPVHPDRITNLHGPALEVTKVDAHTADIKIIHGFRAHFRSSMKKQNTKESFENCLIQAPGEQLKKRVLHRGSLSFSDLAELEAPPCDVLDVAHRCQWEIDPAEIQLGRRIAVGGFAEVFLAEYQGTIVAVKRMFDHDEDAIEQFKQEVAILARLRHPNLILFMGYCLTPELSIVSEFMQKGCLYSILRAHDGVPLPSGYMEVVLVSVARGMAYLHSRDPPILHLDLKSPNILIDNCWRVKITDFGLSRRRNRTLVSGNAGGHGTPHWMSPEAIRGEKIDEKSDVYSFGVILWELMTGRVPWGDKNPIQVIAAVGFKQRQLPRPDYSDTLLVTLMERCFAESPEDRPSFPEILRILDGHYSREPDQNLAMLKIKKVSETSEEPLSPAVGTVVEILSSTTPTTTSSKTPHISDPSLDDSASAGTPLKEKKRSIERLAEFEDKIRSQSVVSHDTMPSPFAQFASTPLESHDQSDDEQEVVPEITDTQSCDPVVGPRPAEGSSGLTHFSPFAAFSAMPFVDSRSLSMNGPPAESGSMTAHKSLKSPMSAADPSTERGSDPLSPDRPDASFFHLDAKEDEDDEQEWKIKVADVEEFQEEEEEEFQSQLYRASCSVQAGEIEPDVGPSTRRPPPSSRSTESGWSSRESFVFNDEDDPAPDSEDVSQVRPIFIPPMRFRYTRRAEFPPDLPKDDL